MSKEGTYCGGSFWLQGYRNVRKISTTFWSPCSWVPCIIIVPGIFRNAKRGASGLSFEPTKCIQYTTTVNCKINDMCTQYLCRWLIMTTVLSRWCAAVSSVKSAPGIEACLASADCANLRPIECGFSLPRSWHRWQFQQDGVSKVWLETKTCMQL